MRITEQQAIEQFEDSLNEGGDVYCGSRAFEPARVLRELDPMAYRMDFQSFCDACGYDFDLEQEDAGGRSMITAERLASLTNFSAEELTQAMEDSGYRDERFLTARFLGITNNLQFCYQVQFSDDEDQLQTGKVFLTYNPVHGTVIAEY